MEVTQSRFGGEIFPQLNTTVLVIGRSRCTSGMDFQESPADFRVDGTSVVATLPDAKIINCGEVDLRFRKVGGLFQAEARLYERSSAEAIRLITNDAGRSSLIPRACEQAVIVTQNELYKKGATRVEVRFPKDSVCESVQRGTYKAPTPTTPAKPKN